MGDYGAADIDELLNMDVRFPVRVDMQGLFPAISGFEQWHPGVAYALIKSGVESWWWGGAQYLTLRPESPKRVEVWVFLCKSGRYVLQYMSNAEPIGVWYLTDPAQLVLDSSGEDWAYCGGNPIPIAPAGTVGWEVVWEAVAFLFLSGLRHPALSWTEQHALEEDFGPILGEP